MTASSAFHLPVSDFAYYHRFAILGIVITDSVMASLDGSMVNIVLPTITTAFNATLADSQWVITAYLLTMTSLFIICGKFSEFMGVCRLFMVGSILFTLSSLGCGISADLNQLIFFRIVQGIGSSMVAGISTVIIFRVFPSHEIGRALGYSGSIIGVCAMFGPAIGGIINDLWGWQYIFFINVPIGIILFFCNLKYLRIPESVVPHLDIDWIGAITLISTMVFFFLFCGEIGSSLMVTGKTVFYAGISTLAGIIFILQESRYKYPLLDLSIFKNSRYVIPVGSSLLLGIANYSLITLFPFYGEGVLGLTSFDIGMILVITPTVQIFASGTVGWMIDRYHWRYLAGFGLVIVTVSGFFMGYAWITLNLALILVILIIRSIGASLFQGQKSIEVMSSLPTEKAGIASSVSTTAGCLGASLGILLASVLLTLELNAAGYQGPVLSAGIELLSRSTGYVIILTGAFCAIGACASIIRNMDPASGKT